LREAWGGEISPAILRVRLWFAAISENKATHKVAVSKMV